MDCSRFNDSKIFARYYSFRKQYYRVFEQYFTGCGYSEYFDSIESTPNNTIELLYLLLNFRKLVFARYPVLALCLISYIILGLSYGIYHLKVTVNPIEIWASPDSRSRIEKNYFETHFTPFYRLEQIYIKPTNNTEVYNIIKYNL